MSESYADDADNRGIFIYGDEEIHGLIADYHARGFQIATHAIGDAAIEQVLSGYERAIGNAAGSQRRHLIEHCGFLSQSQLDRMARAGVLPAPQRSEEHTSELQSLMRIQYAVFCLQKKNNNSPNTP